MLIGRIGWMYSILKGLGMEVKSRNIWCGLSFVPAFRVYRRGAWRTWGTDVALRVRPRGALNQKRGLE